MYVISHVFCLIIVLYWTRKVRREGCHVEDEYNRAYGYIFIASMGLIAYMLTGMCFLHDVESLQFFWGHFDYPSALFADLNLFPSFGLAAYAGYTFRKYVKIGKK